MTTNAPAPAGGDSRHPLQPPLGKSADACVFDRPELAPPVPAGRPFGHLTIGATTVALLAADRCPTNRKYFLHDDAPAIEFGPDPDPATVANGVMAMVPLLRLAPPTDPDRE